MIGGIPGGRAGGGAFGIANGVNLFNSELKERCVTGWFPKVSAAQGDTGSKRLDGTTSVNSARTGLGQQIKDR